MQKKKSNKEEEREKTYKESIQLLGQTYRGFQRFDLRQTSFMEPFNVPSFSAALLPYCVNKVSLNE